MFTRGHTDADEEARRRTAARDVCGGADAAAPAEAEAAEAAEASISAPSPALAAPAVEMGGPAAQIPDIASLQARVAAWLADRDGLVVLDWDTLQPGLKQAIQADMSSAFFMYGILVILVAFSVLNTQLMSVLERTHEFGIVMALGLTPGRLGRLVLLETAIMGMMGFAIGVLFVDGSVPLIQCSSATSWQSAPWSPSPSLTYARTSLTSGKTLQPR